MSELEQYSIVCQEPGSAPWTFCAYTGDDLSQVIGVTQAVRMPPGTYGWIQNAGEAILPVIGGAEHVYLDLTPNIARLEKQGWPVGGMPLDKERQERLCQLDPWMIEVGDYCKLLREARDVFIDGYFYSCVAMCGIAMERFQFDKATPHGATRKHKMDYIRSLLEKHTVLKTTSLTLCKNMANLRNDYAHGHGVNPADDARKALDMVQEFIRVETDLMRKYRVINGKLHRSK
jgi:hypothetical protein